MQWESWKLVARLLTFEDLERSFLQLFPDSKKISCKKKLKRTKQVVENVPWVDKICIIKSSLVGQNKYYKKQLNPNILQLQ